MDMVKKMKATQASLPAAIGIGIAVSVVISIAMAAVAALLISTEKMEVSTIPVCTAITHLLSAFAGSWIACFAAKEKRLMTGCITVTGYILVLLAVTAILLEGQYSGIALGIIMSAIGGCFAVLAGMRQRKGRSRKHKIPAYR